MIKIPGSFRAFLFMLCASISVGGWASLAYADDNISASLRVDMNPASDTKMGYAPVNYEYGPYTYPSGLPQTIDLSQQHTYNPSCDANPTYQGIVLLYMSGYSAKYSVTVETPAGSSAVPDVNPTGNLNNGQQTLFAITGITGCPIIRVTFDKADNAALQKK